MFVRIDSSEIIVYLAKQQDAEKQVTISMDKIVQVARALKSRYTMVRVDLSENSFEILKEYSGNKLSYNDKEVKIKDMQSKSIVQIMHQYYPNAQTIEMLRTINS